MKQRAHRWKTWCDVPASMTSGERFAESMEEWASHFPDRKPCSTTLIIGGPLVVPGAHTLLDLMAYVPD